MPSREKSAQRLLSKLDPKRREKLEQAIDRALNPKESNLHVRVSTTHYLAWKRAAEKGGETLSQWVQRLLNDGAGVL